MHLRQNAHSNHAVVVAGQCLLRSPFAPISDREEPRKHCPRKCATLRVKITGVSHRKNTQKKYDILRCCDRTQAVVVGGSLL
jgi:hypothetical protein